MSHTKILLGVGITLCSLASMAEAQTCKQNSDCMAGYFCAEDTVTSTARPCAKGEECTASPEITASVIRYCKPIPCTVDADCGGSLICHTESYEECSGGAALPCKAGATDCPTITIMPVETCTKKSNSYCAYKWQLRCNADLDCGEGFSCKPMQMGVCSASGASGASGSSGQGTGTATPTGTAPSGGATTVGGATTGSKTDPAKPEDVVKSLPPTPPDCTVTETFPGSCVPKATTCTADTDCPATFTCVEMAASKPPISSIAVGEPSPTNTGTAPLPLTKQCVSPFSGRGANDGVVLVDLPSTATPPKSAGGTTGPTAGPTLGATGGASGNPESDTAKTATESSGCQLGSGSSGSFLGLGLIGLLAILLHRTRRV